MSATQRPAPDEPLIYQIRLKGYLRDEWDDWFGAVTITLIDDGTTQLICHVVDQAELHGILRKVRDIGMTLISIQQLELDDDTD